MSSRLLLLLLLLVFAAPASLLAADEAAQPKKDIYVWTDEEGVVHMRDKKPEHLQEGLTRMEQREQYLDKHPETRQQSEALTSGKNNKSSRDSAPHDESMPFDPEHSPAPHSGQDIQPFPQGQNFPEIQLSPMQLIVATGLPLLIGLLFYVFTSYILYRIGRKFGEGSFIGYLIPIWNVVLLCRCAGITGWFVLFLFVPIINIFVTFLIWGKIAERLGKNMVLWGLLCTLLGLPIIILAFDGSRPVDMAPPTQQPPQEEQPNVYI